MEPDVNNITALNTPQTPPRSRKKVVLTAIAILLLILIGVLFLIFSKNNPLKLKDSSGTEIINDGETGENVTGGDLAKINDAYKFAEFNKTSTEFSPKLENYTVKIDELENLNAFKEKKKLNLNSDQIGVLESNNFYLTKNNDVFYLLDSTSHTQRYDDWTYLYANEIANSDRPVTERSPENSVFVTTDSVLHIFHKLLSKEFSFIEQKFFYKKISLLTDDMFKKSIEGYNTSKSDAQKQSYQRLIEFFAVPKSVLDTVSRVDTNSYVVQDQALDTAIQSLKLIDEWKLPIPQSEIAKIKTEVERVYKSDSTLNSEIYGELEKFEGFEFIHDYTQYTVRSHYTKNPVLRSYFRAMMWYGRTGFLTKSFGMTLDAVNITNMLKKSPNLQDWEAIYAATSFFVGESDDLGITQYDKAMTNVGYADENDIEKLKTELANEKGPQIMSSIIFGQSVTEMSKQELQNETKSFRFMGQRFTPDSFVYSYLTQGQEKPDPETGQRLPSMTTPLLFMSTLGNKTAETYSLEWISKNAKDSDKVLPKKLDELKIKFVALDESFWTQNIYLSWIYAIDSLDTAGMDKKGYPMFMKNSTWDDKSLQASLGSYTELKHDTLLYSKQSYAEMGAGGDIDENIPPVPKGYVEPNIEFYDRVLALNKMVYEGFDSRGLMDNVFEYRNLNFNRVVEQYRDISVQELQNDPINEETFEQLRTSYSVLNDVVSPLPDEIATENLARSAVIADLHTDVVKSKILYVATGIPDYIYVAVKDVNGTRLTQGLVYRYYEFTGELGGNRHSDESWKEVIYSGGNAEIPNIPAWSQKNYK